MPPNRRSKTPPTVTPWNWASRWSVENRGRSNSTPPVLRKWFTTSKLGYQIISENRYRCIKMRTDALQKHVKFSGLDNNVLEQQDGLLTKMFQNLIDDVAKDFESQSLIGFSTHIPGLENGDIWLPLAAVGPNSGQLNGKAIRDRIASVLNSNQQIVLAGLAVKANFVIVTPPEDGSGGSKFWERPKYDEEWLRKSTSIIQIKNKDDLCLARALVTAKARVDGNRSFESLRKGRLIQETEAKRLHKLASVPLGPCGLDAVAAFQQVLSGYQLRVYHKESFNVCVFDGPGSDKHLNLFLHDGHYDIITNMCGFFGKGFFCLYCNKSCNKKENHSCKKFCRQCEHFNCLRDPNGSVVVCKQSNGCGILFHSQNCYDRHKFKKPYRKRKTDGVLCYAKSLCENRKLCKTCCCIMDRRKLGSFEKHKCDEMSCPICHKRITKGQKHECIIEKLELPDEKETTPRFIFFGNNDFECTQDTELLSNNGTPAFLHTPNMVVALKVCDLCIRCRYCASCGPRKIVFKGDDTLFKFGDWLFRKEHDGCKVICHNGKGYDYQFLMQYLVSRCLKPTVVKTGQKILCLTVGNIQCIDSLAFLPFPLAALPHLFGVKDVKKGFYPHDFNTKENAYYKGKWPSRHYYSPETMSPDVLKDFDVWLPEQTDKEFCNQTELEGYCFSDTETLKQCFLKFREKLIETVGFDAIWEHDVLTLASTAMVIFRRKFFGDAKICVDPPGGYRVKDRQSIEAKRWLTYVQNYDGITLQTALSPEGEAVLNVQGHNYKPDGLCRCCKTKIYEYYGCGIHGCRLCFRLKRDKIYTPDGRRTITDAYCHTMKRQKQLENAGYTVVAMWQCCWYKKLKADKAAADFCAKLEFVDPMMPRECLYGGRTNVVSLYKKCYGSGCIFYIDIVSLYPYVLKYMPFGKSSPIVLSENIPEYSSESLPKICIVKCRILPPQSIFHPVLPYRSHGKLLFPCCAKCADDRNVDDICRHKDPERSWIGAFCSPELKIALSLNYKILETYEVWEWEDFEQYDPSTKTGGFFTEYINVFLKMKQEADGLPEWVKTEVDLDKYIDEYFAREGIRLFSENANISVHDIEKRNELRTLAKLFLNSLWGKFGQRFHLKKSEYLTDPAEFFDLITNPSFVTNSVDILNDQMVLVSYQSQLEYQKTYSYSSTTTAAFVTSHARSVLFSYLERLGKNALYFDTDSVFYYSETGEPLVETGNFLGQMKDEIYSEYRDPSVKIVEFCSTGPKSYGYRLSFPDKPDKIVLKLKGLRQNLKTKEALNFDVLKRLITEKPEDPVIFVPDTDIRIQKHHKLITKDVSKIFQVTADKRIPLADGSYLTVPYGYMPEL